MRIGILGSGILGLTAAYELVKKGHQVVVLERSEEIGGLLSSVKIGDSYLERFYHHIFKSDRQLISLIEELGLKEKLEWIRSQTSIYYQDKVFQFDSPLTVLKFPPLSLVDRLRVGLSVFYLKLLNNYAPLEKITAYEWVRKWMGERSWEIIWGPLFKGKFGDLADKIIMSWFWSRVHVRSSSLGYFKGGFYQLCLSLSEKIKEKGGQVLTSQEVTEIREFGNKVKVFTKNNEFEFDKCLVTIPTQLFFNLAKLPDDYKNKYQPPLHYAAINTILLLDKKLTDIYWLNISDKDFPFLVFVEHTNFRDYKEYDRNYVIYLGNYLPQDHPMFKEGDEEILKRYLPYLKKINPTFDQSQIKKVIVSRSLFAQPIVTKGYKSKLPPHETPIKNVILANMSQVYPEDRGQNYSVKLAQKVVERFF